MIRIRAYISTLLATVALLTCGMKAQAQGAVHKRSSVWRIGSQVLGATLSAAVAGTAAYALFDKPKDTPGCHRGFGEGVGYCPNANTAFAIGSFLGSTAMIQLIGPGDGGRGSLAATAIGTGIPTVPLLLGRNNELTALAGIVFGAPAQGILGTLGYQLTRTQSR